MTEEKWMTFDELPDGFCVVGMGDGLPGQVRLKLDGKYYYPGSLGKFSPLGCACYRPIDPNAIEVGELFLRWAEQAMSHLNPEIKVSNHMITVCGHDASNNPKEAFRDFFERMKPKEPETTVKDIPPMKFGANPTGLFFRTIRGGLEFTSDLSGGKGWILSNQDSDNPPCTIHNTLEEATDAAKEARQ